MKCEKCGRESERNKGFCIFCGNELKENEELKKNEEIQPTVICEYCKNEYNKTEKICPKCGKKNSNKYKWLGIALLIVIPISILFIAMGFELINRHTKNIISVFMDPIAGIGCFIVAIALPIIVLIVFVLEKAFPEKKKNTN